jgi:hypothetical protein
MRRSVQKVPAVWYCVVLALLCTRIAVAQDMTSLMPAVMEANLNAKTVRATYTVRFALPAPGQASRALEGLSILDYACEAGPAEGVSPVQRFVLDMEAGGGGEEVIQLWSRATYDGQRLVMQRLSGPITGELSVLNRPPQVSEQPLAYNTVFLPLPGALLLDALEQEFTAIELLPEEIHEGFKVWAIEATPRPDGPWSKMLSKVALHIDRNTGVVRHATYYGLNGELALELRATELVAGLPLPEGTFTLPTP